MTRTEEQIEADLAAVRRDDQEAVETHRVAKVVADDLRGRAMAGDTSVTAAALAEAEHAAEFAELPIPAKFGAIALSRLSSSKPRPKAMPTISPPP